MPLIFDQAVEEESIALEIKAGTFTLPVIRLLRVAMDALAVEVEKKVAQAPDFFLHTPVVIDLTELNPASGTVNFPQLVGMLRGFGMMPIGLRGGTALDQEAARAMELAVLGEERHKPRVRHDGAGLVEVLPMPDGESGTAGLEPGPSLIMRPVRSGQKVYAAGSDLTVVAAVNPGAELMADGNIHVYGPLRGRVFAGMKGNKEARIFCLDLRAELVAIAGHYRVSENIPAELKGARVQIFLDRDVLRIEPF